MTTSRRTLLTQLVQFGLVGGIGFIVDTSVFTALRLTVLAPEHVHAGPVIAKVVSTAVAILANWLGNRYWTFREHRSDRGGREAVEFFLVSLLGMGVSLACLWTSHYAMGLTSALADTVSANVIGLVLGSAIRFVLYRYWVYAPRRASAPVAAAASRPAGRQPHLPTGTIRVVAQP